MIDRKSKTFESIRQAFANESAAVVRYLIFADIAAREGKGQAEELFKKMAKNELEHAKAWYKTLYDVPEDTLKNLHFAATAENGEWKSVYPQAAKQAAAEGYGEVSALFERIASIECDHERRFFEMLLAEGQAVEPPADSAQKAGSYFCLFCGMPAAQAMEVCPTCGASDSFVAE